MFTHKNTYMDMSVRAYFDPNTPSIYGAGSGDFFKESDNISIVYTKFRENPTLNEAAQNSPQAQIVNTNYNSKFDNITQLGNQKLTEHRGQVGREAESEALKTFLGMDIPDSLSISSFMRAIRNIKNNTGEFNKIRSLFNDYENAGRNGNLKQSEISSKEMGIQSKIIEVLRNHGYQPNGSFGPFEKGDLRRAAEQVLKRAGMPETQRMLDGYQYNVDATRQQATKNSAEDLAHGLITLEDFMSSTYADARVPQQTLKKSLEKYLEHPINIQALSGKIFGRPVQTKEELKQMFVNDGNKRHEFYNMINQGAAVLLQAQGDASWNSGSIQKIVNGNLIRSVMQERRQGKTIEQVAYQKIDDIIAQARSQINAKNLSPEQKQKMVKALENVNREKIKAEIIKYAGASAGFNVAPGNLAAAAGATFTTALKGLTLSPVFGVGQNGTVFGVNVRYGAEKDLGTIDAFGKQRDLTGSVGANAGVGGKGVVFFGDASVVASDRIMNIDGTDIGDAKSHGLHVIGGSGFGMVGVSRLENRYGNIEKYKELMRAFAVNLALESDIFSVQAIQRAANAVQGKVGDIQGYVRDNYRDFLKNNGITQSSSFEEKFYVLEAFANYQGGVFMEDVSQDTKDMMNFSGGFLGIGHAFGITFPALGLSWQKVTTDYKKTGIDNHDATHGYTTVTSEMIRHTVSIAHETELPPELRSSKAVEFFLNARSNEDFRDYQKNLTAPLSAEGAAAAALMKYVNANQKKFTQATGMQPSELQNLITKDKDALSDILVLTSGTSHSRLLGKLIDANGASAVDNNPSLVKRVRKTALAAVQNKFGSDSEVNALFNQYYELDTFKQNLRKGKQAIQSDAYFGSISYSQTGQQGGRAKGLDQLTANTPIYGETDVTNRPGSKKLLERLIQEFQRDRSFQHDKLKSDLGLESDALNKLLLEGGTIRNKQGKVIKYHGTTVCLAMSGANNATCFNGAAFAKVGDFSVDNKKFKTTIEENGQMNSYSSNVRNYNIGVTAMGTKDKVTTVTEQDDGRITTITEQSDVRPTKPQGANGGSLGDFFTENPNNSNNPANLTVGRPINPSDLVSTQAMTGFTAASAGMAATNVVTQTGSDNNLDIDQDTSLEELFQGFDLTFSEKK